MEGGNIFGTRIIIFAGFLGLKNRDDDFKIYVAEYKRVLLLFFIVVCWILTRYQTMLVEMAIGERPMNGAVGGASILLAMIVLIFGGSIFMKSLTLKKENQLLIVREEMLSRNYRDLLNMIEKTGRWFMILNIILRCCGNTKRAGSMKSFGNIWGL